MELTLEDERMRRLHELLNSFYVLLKLNNPNYQLVYNENNLNWGSNYAYFSWIFISAENADVWHILLLSVEKNVRNALWISVQNVPRGGVLDIFIKEYISTLDDLILKDENFFCDYKNSALTISFKCIEYFDRFEEFLIRLLPILLDWLE